MNILNFAREILYSSDLNAKITARPQSIVDSNTGQLSFDDSGIENCQWFETPLEPGRPAGLGLSDATSRHQKTPFPNLRELENASSRGIFLHFLGNHELLAMELMALALLRFTSAPRSFRQGIVATILEEQKHLSLYIRRMESYGIGFGHIPVNRFFWDCLAPMATPLDYVTGMSMTLEQANLDFSRYYRDIFDTMGDKETADLLNIVYQEEIGHVKHGVIWFDRLRPHENSDWEEYKQLLPKTLSPRRAKGIGFDSDARSVAGLTPGFIAELSVFQESRGRPPNVYLFNPGCEAEIANPRSSYMLPAALDRISSDLGSIMQFVAKEDDVIWVKKRPSAFFLMKLQEAGIAVPQFIENLSELKSRPIQSFEAWGLSPSYFRKVADFSAPILSPKKNPPNWQIYSKEFSASLLRELENDPTAGQVFQDLDTLKSETINHFKTSKLPLVVKAPFGTSGRNALRILPSGVEPNQERWMQSILRTQGALVMEPWLEKVLDLSIQINVANQRSPIVGITRFLTDGRGQYIGHVLGNKFRDLPPKLRQALHGGGMLAHLQDMAHKIIISLDKTGYSGPAGIDALIYQSEEKYRLKSLVEINPRFTMGRIALELDRHVHHGAQSYWLHVTSKMISSLGYNSFAEFARSQETLFPVQRQKSEPQLITGGFIATNDPQHCQSVLSILLVGSACEMKAKLLGENPSLD